MLRRSRIEEDDDLEPEDEPSASVPSDDDDLGDDVVSPVDQVEPDDDGLTDLHGLRLLVINDDPHSCELISRLVESLGCRARRVGAPEGVVAFIADPMNEIGAVILDLRAGVDVSTPVLEDIRMIDGKAGEMPVAVLTSTADDPSSAWAAGADMFMARPFHADDFLHEFETMLMRSPAERAALRDSRGA